MASANAIVLVVWGLFAASVVVRSSARGAATFDDRLEAADRRLVGSTAFYLVVPLLVLLAQALEVALFKALGAELGRFETWVYWGVVEPAAGARITPLARAALAALEPLSLALAAATLIAWTRLRPSNAARNLLRLETARILLVLVFGVHPIASLLVGHGALATMRDALNAHLPQSGDVVLLAYGVAGALVFWRWRAARALRLLASPLHDAARSAGARLHARPDDPIALRTLGATQLAVGDPRAIDTLERALAQAPDDPATELLLGRAHLDRGRASLAAERLRHAGLVLEERGDDESLLFEVTLALTSARIALGDADGALLTAEAAREQAPRDPRALLVLADALVAGARFDEAKARLEGALEGASGALRREIERRLAALAHRR